ncbi:dioxygenase small subunit (plasmid) [Cupriavidus necator N-1]|uniref:Dioxygenase small subunit n=1 Tax=Cupriavidus necator (strain ATCC 43291 / DSM 13513 / CCUG 52238 / LMG 8453 / N-1) TaxID=1042878 RepID=F8GVP3_CUPNN|nr:aromatic-ring-hydroxylating dioxygenase subunit beta [Cupriavidus necator]AEI82663.1 dioxygenase small subunit [Cupriavidus necator N-1]MDX6007656.1 aromatic-ring-hydroxylating dioxygenase subunit beta [Cupriavidus necator]
MKDRIAPLVKEVQRNAETIALESELRSLYDEVADLLDHDEVERFPSYFIEDCIYQVVSRENYAEGLPQATIYCDGVNMVQDRVTALRETQVYVPRIWRHFISGVRITAIEDGEIHARGNFLLTEAMSDADPTVFLVGQYIDVLVRVGGTLKFRQRLAVFDNHHVRRSLIVPV